MNEGKKKFGKNKITALEAKTKARASTPRDIAKTKHKGMPERSHMESCGLVEVGYRK